MLKLSRVGRHQTKKHKHRRAAAAKLPSCSTHPSSVDSWHLFFFGGGELPTTLKKQLTIPPQTAAKLCALNLFFRPEQ